MMLRHRHGIRACHRCGIPLRCWQQMYCKCCYRARRELLREVMTRRVNR